MFKFIIEVKKQNADNHIYVLAKDSDFSGNADGRFKYIGTDEYIEIPHIIKGVPVTSYAYMFQETFVKGVKSTNTNVTNMQNMFASSKAIRLDLSQLNTSYVEFMDSMFASSKATSLDLSSFDTANVTNMYHIFYKSKATSLDLSSFDISKVTSMSWMFYGCLATTGYARIQEDADKFNASTNKPPVLTFVVK